jgi:hypothetical protein
MPTAGSIRQAKGLVRKTHKSPARLCSCAAPDAKDKGLQPLISPVRRGSEVGPCTYRPKLLKRTEPKRRG